ncbi:hypothetical protein PMEGAPR185_31660 [Priestia megaterium]
MITTSSACKPKSTFLMTAAETEQVIKLKNSTALSNILIIHCPHLLIIVYYYRLSSEETVCIKKDLSYAQVFSFHHSL